MAVKFHDYYEALGVPRNADQAQIKQAYRKLARKHHQDVNPGDKAAEERFKEINEAHEVLSDPEKCLRYDELGADWKAGMDFAPPPRGAEGSRAQAGSAREPFRAGDRSGGFSDFFGAIFGNRGAGDGFEFSSRGSDVESDISITLEEAHHGTRRVVRIPVEEPCPACGGSGMKEGKVCSVCDGTGTKTKLESFTVNIPGGVQDTSVIRVPGKGGAGSGGGSRGDLYFRVHIQPDERFRLRSGSDTELELPMAPWEVVLGGTVKVPTLDGLVEIRIPPGSQGGQSLRLRGKGLAKPGGGQGDHYVRLKVVVPTKPSEKEAELLKKLAAESDFKPREAWN
ncbi:MAG: DnaJ C-terminal domain-containing protein [Terriglobia bacterium]